MKFLERIGANKKNVVVLSTIISIIITICMIIYLVVLPKVVSSPKTYDCINNLLYKHTGSQIVVKNPILKTSFSPIVTFCVDDFRLIKNNTNLLVLTNINTKFSFNKILCKNFWIKTLGADYVYLDVNGILALLPEQKQETKQVQSDWKIDFFDSIMYVKNLKILYDLNNDLGFDVTGKNFKIDNTQKKCRYVHFDINTVMKNGKETAYLKIADENKVYIKNKKIFVDNCEFHVNKSIIGINAVADKKQHFSIDVFSNNFHVKNVTDLIKSNLIIPNGDELLALFKDISGDFDFNINLSNKGLKGDVNLNKLGLILIPINDVPVNIHKGKIEITTDTITLKDFEGYYGTREVNAITFGGTVKDYTKTIDTNIVGDAVVTNDFAKFYLSEMIGYPIGIEGKADTKLILKSKNGIVDLKWLFRISENDDLLVGGEPLSKYKMKRVLVSDFHIDKNIMDIKNIDYYVSVPNSETLKRRQILRLTGKIDFAKGVDFREMGFDVAEPMPSEFLNMVMRQAFFKGGTIVGKLKAIDGPKGVKLFGNLNLNKIRVPSQRLYLEKGQLTTNFDKINICSNGKYRRSDFSLSGEFNNNIAFPIVINDLTLGLKEIDIDRLIRSMNNQGTTQKPTEAELDINSDSDVPTFDLANLIIKKCVFNLDKGIYKDIIIGNLHATMSLDENSQLKLDSNRFDFAEGYSSCHACCDIKNHKYNIKLGAKDVNSDLIATSLLGLKKEISGKASGIINLYTDSSLKLNGEIKFLVKDGTIGKVGLIEYILNFASLFRNPLAMISPATFIDIVNIPEGNFEKIDGKLIIRDNVVETINIKSYAKQLSAYIVGCFDLEQRDASLRIYTKFSNKNKGFYGALRYFSLSTLASKLSFGGSRSDKNYYSSELTEIPELEVDEDDCQIFLTKVEGDVERFNFISSLKKLR